MKSLLQGFVLAACFFGLVAYKNGDKKLTGATVSAEKMNVVYVGVDNPMSIVANGIANEDLQVQVTGAGAQITYKNGGNYLLKTSQQGELQISLTDKQSQKKIGTFNFRSKRIPDPVIKLSGKTGGALGTGEMRAQVGLIPAIENFDFDARCEISSFILYYKGKGQDPVEIKSAGGRFSGAVLQATQNANTGDQYQFVDIRAKCPGDVAGRGLNSLAFSIK
jgi:GldM C-terminal domain